MTEDKIVVVVLASYRSVSRNSVRFKALVALRLPVGILPAHWCLFVCVIGLSGVPLGLVDKDLRAISNLL